MQAYFSVASKHPGLTKLRLLAYAGRLQRVVNQAFNDPIEIDHNTCQAFSTNLKAADEQANQRALLEGQGYQVSVVGAF